MEPGKEVDHSEERVQWYRRNPHPPQHQLQWYWRTKEKCHLANPSYPPAYCPLEALLEPDLWLGSGVKPEFRQLREWLRETC